MRSTPHVHQDNASGLTALGLSLSLSQHAYAITNAEWVRGVVRLDRISTAAAAAAAAAVVAAAVVVVVVVLA